MMHLEHGSAPFFLFFFFWDHLFFRSLPQPWSFSSKSPHRTPAIRRNRLPPKRGTAIVRRASHSSNWPSASLTSRWTTTCGQRAPGGSSSSSSPIWSSRSCCSSTCSSPWWARRTCTLRWRNMVSGKDRWVVGIRRSRAHCMDFGFASGGAISMYQSCATTSLLWYEQKWNTFPCMLQNTFILLGSITLILFQQPFLQRQGLKPLRVLNGHSELW